MKFYHPVLLFLLLCLTLAWLYLYWHRRKNIGLEEGFQQERNFVSKIGNDIYDSFYAEIYDEIMVCDADHLINNIIQITQPTLRYSSFLDVGCGTGNIVQKLNDYGYIVTGIDNSPNMIEFCQQKILNDDDLVGGAGAGAGAGAGNKLRFIEGDVLNSMQFDRAQFSHIICSGLTLYEWCEADVLRFFRNCYFWTIAGGYLFLHLVDPSNFLPMPNFSQNFSQKRRIVNSDIQFPDFSYSSNYSFDNIGSSVNGSSVNGTSVNGSSDNESASQCSCTHRETFIDLKTQHVRENEIMLYFLPIEKIVSMALRSGFVVKAQWNLLDSPYADSHQFIYMFERTL